MYLKTCEICKGKSLVTELSSVLMLSDDLHTDPGASVPSWLPAISNNKIGREISPGHFKNLHSDLTD